MIEKYLESGEIKNRVKKGEAEFRPFYKDGSLEDAFVKMGDLFYFKVSNNKYRFVYTQNE